MLATVRKFTKSWVAALLIGLLIISFAVFGVNDAFKGAANTDIVVKAGSHEITRADFKREFEVRKQEIEQRAQRPIGNEEAVANGLDQQMLKLMSAQQAIYEVLYRLGVRPGDKLVTDQIARVPAFFDQITGKFDRNQYLSLLNEQGLTDKKFTQDLADDIARQHGLGAINIGLKAPLVYGALQGAFAMEAREAGFFVLSPAKVGAPTAPTDAQLNAFLRENAAQVTRPEFRQLTIVRFSSKALAAGMAVDPAEIDRLFNYRKDQLYTPETRSLVQIPAKDQAAAAAIAARLAKGEDPAAVAKAVGATVIAYDNKPKTAIADRKVADAAFALSAGQASGPIQGALGFAVVKVLAVTPGKSVEMAAIRPQLEAEARERAAQEKISDLADQFEKAYASGASMADAAKSLGLAPIVTSPITAQGQSLDGKPSAGLSPKLLETAFKLPQGGDSEITEDSRGEYFIVRVEKVTPPALPALAEVREPLTRAYMTREMQTRVQTQADALAERIRKGESLAAVAASVGATPAAVSGVTRMAAQQEAARIGGPLVSAILGAKTGDVVVAPTQGGIAIARVTAVRPGDTALLSGAIRQASDQLTGQMMEEFQSQIADAAGRVVKVEANLEYAQRALGVEPTPAAKVKNGSKDKAKAGAKDEAKDKAGDKAG